MYDAEHAICTPTSTQPFTPADLAAAESSTRVVLDDVIDRARVTTAFQPIVNLASFDVVGYEALARGPVGPLARPDLLFAAAREHGRLADLDRLCARTAVERAAELGLTAPATLFVNIEPEALDAHAGQELAALCERKVRNLNLVLEITERALASRPAELLAAVARLREAGWRIALDDVGAEDMSLAFMPLLQPDIVKLDLNLVQQRPGPAVTHIMNAVNAYAERSGAVILAEGIEDESHESFARQLGAQLGQGWRYGRPGPRITTSTATCINLRGVAHPSPCDTPFDCLPDSAHKRVGTKALLVETSKSLERDAARAGQRCLVLSSFQSIDHFPASTAARYRRLAEQVSFVGAVGQGLGPEPVAGVRGGTHSQKDPLSEQWCVLVLSPHFSAALIARDLGDTGPDSQRSFEFVLTYDHGTIAAAASSLMRRVTIEPTHGVFAPTRKRQPRVLAQSESTLSRRVLDLAEVAVTLCDARQPDLPLMYVNPAFERLCGRPSEQVTGRDLKFMQGPASSEQTRQELLAAVAEQRGWHGTMIGYPANATRPRRISVTFTPLFDDRGELDVYVGVHKDITQRLEQQQELAAERMRRELAEASLAMLSAVPSTVDPGCPAEQVPTSTVSPARSTAAPAADRPTTLLPIDPAKLDDRFEMLAQLTKELLAVPGAAVSFINEAEQRNPGWAFDREQPEYARTVPRSQSVCRHVVDGGDDVIIASTRDDARTSGLVGLVDGNIRAYAGTPIYGDGNEVVGALCAINHDVHQWTSEQIQLLHRLAAICTTEVHLRQATVHLHESQTRLQTCQAQMDQVNDHLNRLAMSSKQMLREDSPDKIAAYLRESVHVIDLIRAQMTQPT